MRCPIETPEFAERLLAYCSGRLEKESQAALEGHIKTCPACREFVNGQRTVWGALDAWEAVPVSADFDRRLYQRIQQEVSWWDRLARPFRSLMVRQGLPITATAGLLIMAGILSQHPTQVATPPALPAAQADAASAEQVERAIDDMDMLRELNSLLRADTAESKM